MTPILKSEELLRSLSPSADSSFNTDTFHNTVSHSRDFSLRDEYPVL